MEGTCASPARAATFGNPDLPASIRTNNPGAIAPGAHFEGQIGQAGKLVTFDTPENGAKAMVQNLLAYQDKHGLNTPLGIINRWAPADDGNDPEAYANIVARSLGVSPTTAIDLHNPAVMERVANTIAKVESGKVDHGYGPAISSAVQSVLDGSNPVQTASSGQVATDASPAAAPAAGGTQVAAAVAAGPTVTQAAPASGVPQQKVGGVEALLDSKGAPSKATTTTIHGVDSQGRLVAVELPGAVAAETALAQSKVQPQIFGDWSKNGAEYLATVPPADRVRVLAIAQGRMPMPSEGKMNDPHELGVMAAVAKYDPTFEANRYDLRKSFNEGPAAQNINALNQAVGHLGHLLEGVTTLNNNGMPLWNSVANTVLEHTGDTRVAPVRQDIIAVSEELMKAFRGTGASETEANQWHSTFPINGTLPQQKAAIANGVGLLMSRLNTMSNQWNRVSGEGVGPLHFLSSDARKSLASIIAGTADAAPSHGSSAPAPQGQPTPAGAQADQPASPPVPGARQAPDGNWYVADPQRPGKYLKVM